jgi:vancomycin resistance protein VanW
MKRELVEEISDFERRRVEELLARTPRLSERWPAIYPVSVWVHRARRRLQWWLRPSRWATRRASGSLPVRISQHSSLLRRQLGADEVDLQENKVVNLRLASAHVDGLLIRPGETFSFNRTVGNCTARKGYVSGMRLRNGEAISGVGGGLCQLGNLIHWLALHSDLTVVERSEHSFDPFPDKGRVLPWGTGVSIVFNYVDLVLRNDTDTTFQVSMTVGDTYLEGELRADRPQPRSYKVYAACERFFHAHGEYFRTNQLRRRVIDKATGNQVGDELVRENCALVKYLPTAADIIELAA